MRKTSTAWCDPEIAAVLFARGGSGATRLLDLLDWDAMLRAEPKVFVGYSDATALHEALATRLGLSSLFGPMPAALPFGGESPDQASLDHLRTTLFQPEAVQVLRGDDASCVVSGRASGVTVGGTLALLASTIGTAESRPASGGIVVLEDITEPAYRLDNLLTQLLRSGWFDGARGIALGTWVDCGDDALDTVCSTTRDPRSPATRRSALRSWRAAADGAARTRGGAGRRCRNADDGGPG